MGFGYSREKMSKAKFLLIGAGPFARNTYIPWVFLSPGASLEAIIDVESQERTLKSFLKKTPAGDLELVLIPDALKHEARLPSDISAYILEIIRARGINRIILSTEPSARQMYFDLLAPLQIPVLCDKPLFAEPSVCTNAAVAQRYFERAEATIKTFRDHATPLSMNLHRRHRESTLELLKQLKKYRRRGAALTSMQIYYSGGSHYTYEEMLERENHPLNKGYGMLYHSGFHYIDLVSEFVETQEWDSLDSVDVVAFKRTGDDFYRRPAGGASGEMDLHLQIAFKSRQNVLCLVQLALHTTGYNLRKKKNLPADLYTQMGRVKHESISLTLDPSVHLVYDSLDEHRHDAKGRYRPKVIREELLAFDGKRNRVERVNFSSQRQNKGSKSSLLVDFARGKVVEDTLHPLAQRLFWLATRAVASPGETFNARVKNESATAQ